MKGNVRRSSAIVSLVALFCGGTAAATYTYAQDKDEPSAQVETTPGEDIESQTKAFSDAKPGQCINWKYAADGSVSDFETVDCAAAHRFEVSRRENLATYPTSEFGTNAAMPNRDRQAELTTELCEQPTLNYLGGKFDPTGRFSIAPILPPSASWANGDRTLLCGLQVTGENGQATEITGKAATQDQSQVFQAGQCVSVDDKGNATGVDCAADHNYEVTSVVNLGDHFQNYPSGEDLDSYLGHTCTDAATQYLGGDDNLYNSTLESFWTSLTEDSWNGGSRNVNCALTKIHDDQTFATLKGSAKGSFTIDGSAPPPQPSRAPKREQGQTEAPSSASASTPESQ